MFCATLLPDVGDERKSKRSCADRQQLKFSANIDSNLNNALETARKSSRLNMEIRCSHRGMRTCLSIKNGPSRLINEIMPTDNMHVCLIILPSAPFSTKTANNSNRLMQWNGKKRFYHCLHSFKNNNFALTWTATTKGWEHKGTLHADRASA